MSEPMESRDITRLEDFIALARNGKAITLTIDLRRQVVTPKSPPEDGDAVDIGAEMYLLLAKYVSVEQDQEGQGVSKVYVHGWTGEDAREAQAKKHVANERLKMDFDRLRLAGITFTPKFF